MDHHLLFATHLLRPCEPARMDAAADDRSRRFHAGPMTPPPLKHPTLWLFRRLQIPS